MMRWPPASTRRPGWLLFAEGTLAEVPRNVRSNIGGQVLSVERQTAMARACKRTIFQTNVTSRARRTCALEPVSKGVGFATLGRHVVGGVMDSRASPTGRTML